MEKLVKLGVIGLGCRGRFLLESVVIPLRDKVFDVRALCDVYPDRVEAAAESFKKKTGIAPFISTDYRDILARNDVDAVIISTSWESHIPIAIDSMRAGKYAGIEVGGAYTVDDCQKLVDTFEETGTHCMFLENCCYGKRELMILNMYRSGDMGEIVHCSGGYMHDLRAEIVCGKENRHYRLRNYLHRNCENYPTHELGPIAKLLDINNGNRMLTLTSVASDARGLHEYVLDRRGASDLLAGARFMQGDVVTTVIKCAGGQTITLTLDTTLPRYYSRGFTVRGTKAAYLGETDCVFVDKEHEKFEFCGEKLWGNAKEYEDRYLHPIWRDYEPQPGHDGIDWLVLNAFAEAVSKNARPPIDVYDAAAYMCITPLSELSIARGGAPVDIPDFTRGRWYRRTEIADLKYSLDRKPPAADLYDVL